MKKITIFSLHLGIGGIEKYISGLSKMLEEDYEIEFIITYKLEENPSFPISNKINIKYLINGGPNKDEIRKCIKRKKFISLIKELMKSIKILTLKKLRTKKALKTLSTDYLITTRTYETKLANKILKKSNIVKICTEHNFPTKKYKKKVLKSITNFDKLVVPTKEMEEIYKSEIGEKVTCINNFIEDVTPKKNKLNNKKLIAVGRFSKEKGFTDLIDIIKEVTKIDPEITLTLIGDGPEKNKIIKKIKDLKLEKNITLTGFLNSYEIEEEMLNSTIYLMTSYTESFGLVLVEAMNASLPIIAFDSSSGARNLVKDVGVLIENRDNSLFSSAIIELLNNKKELTKLSKKSLEKREEFLSTNIKKEWLKLLKENENRSNKKLLFISSTGGHLNEMLMLKSMFKKYPFMLVTENTKTNKDLKETYGKKYTKYLIYGTKKHMLTYPFKLIINSFKSLYYFLLFKPDFIITTGAHTAGPMCLIAKIFRKKVIYIESFANSETKTMTGRIIYKFADLFIVQWKSMLKLYDKATYGGWIY